MNITFTYPFVLPLGALLIGLFFLARYFFFKSVIYRVAGLQMSVQQSSQSMVHSWHKWIIKIVRALILICLVFATARPRMPDERSLKTVDGVAIMLVLDVSGSMSFFDSPSAKKSRFVSAKEEAIRFIQKRTQDICGLVIFGAAAASRCPLTNDKKVLIDIIQSTELGVIDQEGTALCTAIATAANRLRASQARSKIMVVLTDGEPSQHDVVDSKTAIDLAKKLGVKIYTIGIGSEQGGYVQHPLGGWMQVPSVINKKLLYELSSQTGGRFFQAAYQQELQAIYQAIDELETSKHQAPLYSHYFELAIPLLFFVLILLIIECFYTVGRRIVQ